MNTSRKGGFRMPVVSPEVRDAVSHLRRKTSAVENRAETAVDVGVHDMGPQGGVRARAHAGSGPEPGPGARGMSDEDD